LHHALRIALRDGGKPVAVMVLGRPPGSRSFARPDFERIQAARPYLEHALSAADGAFDEETAPSGEAGVAIIDAALNLLYLSPGTENLLRMAAQEGMFGLPPGECMAAAIGIFRPLVARIKGVYAKQECEAPAQHLRNAWGQFTIRAYRLAPVGSSSSGLIGVTIARHVPLALRLLGVPAIQALPRREKEVCLLLLKGMQTQEMSRHLRISPHTVVTYVRGLYRQLGVAGRGELLGLLRREANRSLDGAAGAGTVH
jgi:DNA-binding CsgD family transcriptional regulator